LINAQEFGFWLDKYLGRAISLRELFVLMRQLSILTYLITFSEVGAL
jgi:hypothetical protein